MSLGEPSAPHSPWISLSCVFVFSLCLIWHPEETELGPSDTRTAAAAHTVWQRTHAASIRVSAGSNFWGFLFFWGGFLYAQRGRKSSLSSASNTTRTSPVLVGLNSAVEHRWVLPLSSSPPPLLLLSFIYLYMYLSCGSCRMMESISSIKASPTGWCFDARSPPRFWPPFLLLLLLLHHHHHLHLLLLLPARVLRCPPRAGVTTDLALLYSHMLSPARLWALRLMADWRAWCDPLLSPPLSSSSSSLLSVTAPSARLSPRCGTGYMVIRRNKTCLALQRTCAPYYGN